MPTKQSSGSHWFMSGLAMLVFGMSGSPSGAVASPLKSSLPPVVALPSDTATVEATTRFLENRVKQDPEDFIAYNKLATIYLQRLRETGDLTYVTLANRAAEASLAILPPMQNKDGLTALAQVKYSSHEFAAARDHAKHLTALEPRKGYPFLLLGDAFLELGDYVPAKLAFQKMAQLGGVHGLTTAAIEQRMARLAVIYGDNTRAQQHFVNALTSVLRMPAPPRETVAWCHWQLGETAFARGDYIAADQHYRDALVTYPEYYRALAGVAKVRAAQGMQQEAIEFYQRAIAVIPLPEYVAALGDVYAAANRPDEAQKQYDLVEYMGSLSALNQMLYNRELALFYADHGRNLAQALVLAKKELEVRRDIYTSDVLAWTLYKNDKPQEALLAMTQALRLGTQDARFFFHAGMIYHRLGKQSAAQAYLRRALQLNPRFHPLQAGIAKLTLEALHKNSTLSTLQEKSHDHS